jgi:hypothetical protein
MSGLTRYFEGVTGSGVRRPCSRSRSSSAAKASPLGLVLEVEVHGPVRTLLRQRRHEVLQDRRFTDAALTIEHHAVVLRIVEHAIDGAKDVAPAHERRAVPDRVAGDIGVVRRMRHGNGARPAMSRPRVYQEHRSVLYPR